MKGCENREIHLFYNENRDFYYTKNNKALNFRRRIHGKINY